MAHLVGKLAIDINAGAPNNGRGDDNKGVIKRLRKGNEIFPYVSAQAWRRWTRDSLPADESISPVERAGSGKKQQAHTAGRPDLHMDDDLFGYMVAKQGKSTYRDTVVATGTMLSVTPQKPTDDFGTMSRGFGLGENPVIHEHEFYSAELAADLAIDLPRIGTFALNGMKPALLADTATEAEKSGAQKLEFRGEAALRLDITERRRRLGVLLRTWAKLRGGAKNASHYGDRTPALILLAPMKGGINPFTRVLAVKNHRCNLDTDVLLEEYKAWSDELDGPILLGWAPGFLGDQRVRATAELSPLVKTGSLVIDHPRVVLTGLADRVEAGDHDAWFEDATS